jgi:hypothetical protein
MKPLDLAVTAFITYLTQFHYKVHEENPLKISVDSVFSVVRVFCLRNIN